VSVAAWIRRWSDGPYGEARSLNEWDAFSFGGSMYPFVRSGSISSGREEVEHNFDQYVQAAYKSNAAVFSVEALRERVFSETRFAWQRREQGRGQELFTNGDLRVLEEPWSGGTTQDLLQRMILHADFGGSAFVIRNGVGEMQLLRPDWVTIVRGTNRERPGDDPDGLGSTLLGYIYAPPTGDGTTFVLEPHEVAHFAPIPDPVAMYRGMSWLTPVLREIQGDSLMSEHKLKFFENGATPNMVVSMDASVTPEQFRQFKEKMDDQHAGVTNAYKTLFLGGGADATVVGSDLSQIDFKSVQGHGETRIAMAAGVHPVVVGMSEGMQGSSLNAGNYSQARRNVADTTFHPLWRNAAGSLSTIVRPTGNAQGARLVPDTREVPFLRQDEVDEAQVRSTRAGTLGQLINQGFTPDSAKVAVETGDFSRLEHTGLVSVQLQAPGAAGGG